MNTDANWKYRKLAHAYHRIGSGTTPRSEATEYYDELDGIPWVTTSELRENYIEKTKVNVTHLALADHSALRIYGPGSLMIAMYGATIGRLGIISVDAACNQACCVFEHSDEIENRYLFYWLLHRRADLISLSMGGGQPNLSQGLLKSERALCPPISKQKKIVAYLDQRCGEIDDLIAKKRNLLKLLAEKRSALITRAVTKGLNPNAPMKSSCIDWLGQVPAHWEVVSFKWRCQIPSGQVDPTEEEFGKLPLIAPDFIESGTGVLDEPPPAEQQGAISGKYHFAAGTVVYSKIRPLLAKVCISPFDALCSADMYPIIPSDSLDNNFLFFQLLSNHFTSFAVMESLRVAMPKVNRETLGAFPILIPPIDEQAAIVGEIKSGIEDIDKSRSLIERAIDRLTEYRAAIITKAVTGELEVT
ncbi:restriction endonuclease S subunit [Iodidimonas gelatinilytica]|uniref:Restriction endonuclease S subunit n=1 Tax=Iodidimonas gelatinilytica TaxID=1236966 RepID=A0A5A7MTG7_9PROT|nr:restriction endonuclease subunit S [Iodidimonas gelatinilytica]GEQ98149.1 restriction endonuclease S subunit [Iodidimonas gelatinilytica]